MPHKAMMNGMTSHAFAAIMTATVVIFPTPSDLWHTVFPKDGRNAEATVIQGGVERQPLIVTPTSTTEQMREALDQCIHSYATSFPVQKQCEEILFSVSENILNRTFPDDGSLEAQLALAESMKCRYLWVEGNKNQMATECQDSLPILSVRN